MHIFTFSVQQKKQVFKAIVHSRHMVMVNVSHHDSAGPMQFKTSVLRYGGLQSIKQLLNEKRPTIRHTLKRDVEFLPGVMITLSKVVSSLFPVTIFYPASAHSG